MVASVFGMMRGSAGWGKRGGRRGNHTGLLTLVGRRRRRLVGVDQGWPAAVARDGVASVANLRRETAKRVRLGGRMLVVMLVCPGDRQRRRIGRRQRTGRRLRKGAVRDAGRRRLGHAGPGALYRGVGRRSPWRARQGKGLAAAQAS
jgi:hypothetical protein